MASIKTEVQSPNRPRPKYSRPVIEQDITLYSQDAQYLLYFFQELSIAMYKLGITVQKLTNEESVLALGKLVADEVIKPLEDDLANEAQRVKLLCRENSLKPTVQFTKPFSKTIAIAYPGAFRFLKLIQTLDDILYKLSELWFADVIDDRAYQQARVEWRTRLNDARKYIQDLSDRTLAKLEGKAQDKEEGRSEETTPETEKPESAARESGRKRRQAAAPETETPEPHKDGDTASDQKSGPETAAMETEDSEALSPFASLQ